MKSGRVSLGNENQAIIEVFQNFNFEAGIMMPYDANLLVEKLAENVEELREIEKVSKNII
jgi:heterodisulfide reductase subunit B